MIKVVFTDATDLDYINDEIMKNVSTYDNIGTNYKYLNGINKFEIYSLKSKKQTIYNAIGGSLTLSIMSSICLIGDITNFTHIGSRVLKRYVGLILLMILVTAFVSNIFFPVFSLNISNSVSIYELYNLLINIIPTNILLPFVDNETIKIVIVALFAGYCILACNK